MPAVKVDSLEFNFAPTIQAQRYETWQHYTMVWNAAGGQKAVDVVAVETVAPPMTAWLIEAKDFRVITNPPRPSNIGGLAQTVTDKAAHTLAGLTDAAANAAVAAEKAFAISALSANSNRVVLHLEPHTGPHSALFPAGFPASVLQKLKQLVRAIDPNPLVLSMANTAAAGVPWTVV
ncbi:MAG: hypothetical protein ACLQLG_03395 [Thermoguttaceae bacterium]